MELLIHITYSYLPAYATRLWSKLRMALDAKSKLNEAEYWNIERLRCMCDPTDGIFALINDQEHL